MNAFGCNSWFIAYNKQLHSKTSFAVNNFVACLLSNLYRLLWNMYVPPLLNILWIDEGIFRVPCTLY